MFVHYDITIRIEDDMEWQREGVFEVHEDLGEQMGDIACALWSRGEDSIVGELAHLIHRRIAQLTLAKRLDAARDDRKVAREAALSSDENLLAFCELYGTSEPFDHGSFTQEIVDRLVALGGFPQPGHGPYTVKSSTEVLALCRRARERMKQKEKKMAIVDVPIDNTLDLERDLRRIIEALSYLETNFAAAFEALCGEAGDIDIEEVLEDLANTIAEAGHNAMRQSFNTPCKLCPVLSRRK